MPFRICKSLEIESGHMLSKHPGNCKFPHGHTRKVELVLEAEALDRNDMVCDFEIMKEIVRNFVQSLDHALCMNTHDPRYQEMKHSYGNRVIGFDGLDPTTEIMAKSIYDAVKDNLTAYPREANPKYPLSTDVRIVKVRLWETTTSWAEYSEHAPADF